MTEERYALALLVSSCKSMDELNDKLDRYDNEMIDFFVDSYSDGIITIGVKHYKSQLLTTFDNNGRVKPSLVRVDDPWIWYKIEVPKGFIFK